MVTLDQILEVAFKLFLKHNYEKVTIAEIEKAGGFTRGSIYHFTKSKEDIFRFVCDKYILNAHNIKIKVDIEDKETLYDFILRYITGIKKTMNKMYSIGISDMHRHYFNFILQGTKYYPGFREKLLQMFVVEFDEWVAIIRQAQKKKEISSAINANQLAIQFRSIYVGLAFEKGLAFGLDTDELLEIYLNIYNLIKINKQKRE